MENIEPLFEIDDKGRVMCRNHSKYKYFIEPKDYFQDMYLDFELTCKTCSCYHENNCYFTKKRIDQILFEAYLCRLCGNKIDRMLTVIHKLYYKEIYDVDVPLICCDCYERIKKKDFLSYSKKMTDFYLLNIVISIFLLCYFAYFLSIINFHPIIYYFLIIPLFSFICFIFLIIIIKCIKKLRYFFFGIKYYKKHFINQEIK
ncbi:MAG: hypothetical protein ACFFAH_14015 [Promethearchaeota archaeon]